MAIPLYRSSNFTADNITDMFANPPGGIVTGNLLFIVITIQIDSTTFAITAEPAGWTREFETSNGESQSVVYSKVAVGGEVTSVFFTQSTNVPWIAAYIRTSGGEEVGIVGTPAQYSANVASMTTPAITTTQSDSLILALATMASFADPATTSTTNWSIATGHTEGGQVLSVAKRNLATAGSSGTVTLDFDFDTGPGHTIMWSVHTAEATSPAAIMMGANF